MFSPKLKKVIAGIVCLAFTVTNGSYAVEILNDGGQRQTVVERTKQYAGTLDLTEVRHKAEQAFQSSVKTGDGGVATLSGIQAKCNGFTTSSCGLACCGKQECDTICTANYMSAHGKETCTDPITTSPCGMSCCGKEDCEWVCQNYRIKLNDGDKCNGYIKTPTGENCCGYDECMAKTCNGKTKVVRKDDGKEVECCGEENCYDIMCDYTEKVQDVAGTVQDCCGRDDCNAKYCQNQTSVDSKVVPGKKNIACCGAADCHNKACENYTTTNTPVGQVECCGYEDCHNKECQGRTSAIDKDGNTVSCCENSGVKDQNGNDLRLCSAIDEERVNEENKKNEDNGPRTLVTCVKKHTHETSKGIRTDTGKSYICSDKNGIVITKIDNTTALCKAFNYEERFCRVPLSPTECYPTYFSQATQHTSSVGNGFTEYKGKKEDILACFGKTGPDSNILTPDYCLQNPGSVLCDFYN